MLTLTGLDHVDLAATGVERAGVLAARAEQDDLGHITEIEAYASTVRTTVLADLVPDQVRFVGEAPSFHHSKAIRQKSVWHPHIEMRSFGRTAGNRQCADVRQLHRWIARQSMMLWCDLPGAVLKLPGRIGQNRRELLALRSELKVDARFPSDAAEGHRPRSIYARSCLREDLRLVNGTYGEHSVRQNWTYAPIQYRGSFGLLLCSRHPPSLPIPPIRP